MAVWSRRLFQQFVKIFPRVKPILPERCLSKCKIHLSTLTENIKTVSTRRAPVIVGLTLPSFFGFGKKDEKKEDAVIMLMKRAKLSQMRDNYVGAEGFYHDALSEVNRKRAANKITEKEFLYAITNINDCLAELALIQGQLETADILYKEVIKGCLQIGLDQNDNAIVELSIKLASIYAMRNKPSEARQGYLHSIETQEKKLKEMENPDENSKAILGLALEAFSRFLMMQQEYDAAEKYLTKSYNLALDVLGKDHTQTLVILNDLATIDIMKKKYSKAEERVKTAIETGECVKSPDVPSFYCNLGAIYMRQALYAEAKAACTVAKTLAARNKDEVSGTHAEKCLEKLKEVDKKQHVKVKV